MKNVIVVDVASLHLCLRITVMLLFPLVVLGQWEPNVRLTDDPAISRVSYNNAWCVASSGSYVHVVWWDWFYGNMGIHYKRSTDNGATWETDTTPTNNTVISGFPSVAACGSNVHLVWQDYRDENDEIYYNRSPDNGTNWGTDNRLTNSAAWSGYPSVAVSGSNLHLVWVDDRDLNREIYYKRSTDNGTNWSEDIRLTNNTANSYCPSVAVSGPNVHVVWYDNRDGNYEIYYKRSTDNGANWSTDIRLTIDATGTWSPSIAVSGSNLHLVWVDERDLNQEIYYKRSTDNGTNWETDTRLTNNPYASRYPSIAVSDSNVHLVWCNLVLYNNRYWNYEIYYRHSLDNGTNWETDISLTNDTAWAWSPFVSISGSNVQVVWMDDYNGNSGNSEIYYKRNPTGNPGIEEESLTLDAIHSIMEVYPNPTNLLSVIRYSLPVKGKVSLQLFDISGRLAKTLVDEYRNPGNYQLTLNTNNLSAGVYFLSLETKEKRIIKRLVVIK